MDRNKYDIFLSPPSLSGNEMAYVEEALQNHWITTEGEQVEHFEREIADYTGAVNVLLTNSGTAALHLALASLGVGQDDVVICQSFTFVATANPVLYLGAKPVFVDSEAESWNMDPKLLEEAVEDCLKKGKLPKAIVYVHIYGMPAKVDSLEAVAKKYNIPLVEDAAEAFGAEYKNRKAGGLGDISFFSFNGNKIITTSGGGALLSPNTALIAKARFLSSQAREETLHYEHKVMGYNYRLSNISAAIGRAQLNNIDERVEKRRKVFDFYKKLLTSVEGITFQEEHREVKSNRWLTCIILKDVKTREKIVKKLTDNHIECRPLWKPMHLQPLFKDDVFIGDNLSGGMFQKGICLPSGSNLSIEDIRKVCELILAVL